ncbi:MAG: glycerophosphodiester phosphodiesterase family protein, partial [Paraglaciecola sp.]
MSVFTINTLQAEPIVIAHRGASGYLPEHTLESVTLAYAQGAHYIEQDLVATKDAKLIVLHDIHLETVTDVQKKFPNRKRQDGRFYALDFTLAELKTLIVHERRDEKGDLVFKDRYQGVANFQIATFEEQIELIQQL